METIYNRTAQEARKGSFSGLLLGANEPFSNVCTHEVCQEVNSYLISYDEPSEFSLKIETAVDTITAIGSRYHCE